MTNQSNSTQDTDRISREEMIEMFGSEMPIEAVNLLWGSDGSKTCGELRAELRRIAKSRPSQDTEDVVARLRKERASLELAFPGLNAVVFEIAADLIQSLSDRIDVLEGEKARLADRLKLLSLDVLQWWKTVFGVDYVHTLPGETPGELAARAAERIAALHQEGISAGAKAPAPADAAAAGRIHPRP